MDTPRGGSGLGRILPLHLDNNYRGPRAGLWLFGLVLFVKTGIALGTLMNGRAAAQTADGIPLESFGAAGAQAVVGLFAIWGLAQLAVSAVGLLALLRYRALIPFLFALLLLEHLARRAILWWKPIATAGAHPGLYINLALLVLLTAGLALSLWRRAESPS